MIEKNTQKSVGTPYKFVSPSQKLATKDCLRSLGEGKINKSYAPAVPRVKDPDIQQLIR
jgi:hypothetical protein